MRIGQYGCHCFEKKGGAMRRARLGLCIGDREYGDRFTSCLMNHYRDQLELHMFSQKEALQENWKTLDAIVLSDEKKPAIAMLTSIFFFHSSFFS